MNFQSAASASLKPSASTRTVVIQQSDSSYTAFELTDASPYRIVRTTQNFQRQFTGCPGLPVTGTQPVNQPPEVFTPLRLGGYLWARVISENAALEPRLNIAVFDSALSLTSEAQYPVARVGALAVADVNGDGLPDILIGSVAFHNPDNATVQVLIGKGGSSFQPAASYVISASVFLYSILVADLNGDHKPDLVISSSVPAITGKISVLFGSGDGTFREENTIVSGATLFPSVAITDLNGDGKPDLVFTVLFLQHPSPGSVVEVALGAGDGAFGTPTQYQTGGTDAVAIADLNGDGFPDIVTSGFSILFGDGSGRFPKRADYWQAVAGGIILADFDADGQPDIIVGTGSPAAIAGPVIAVLFAHGGAFGASPVSPPNDVPTSLAPMLAADFDGDGFPDLAALKIGGQVGVLMGLGDGTLRETFRYAPGSGALVGLASGDFNGDGKLDIVAALIDSPVGHLQVLPGRGNGTFEPPIATTTPFGPSAISVSDFNGDGRPDVAFLAADSNALIYLGTGSGTFASPLAFPAGPNPTAMTVGDFNRDGKPDLIVGSFQAEGSLRILFGKGDGTFLAPASIPAVANSIGVEGIVAADLNRDGRLDIAVTTSDEHLLVLLGQDDGTFRPPASYSAIGVGHPFVADLNGDGVLDLISGNFANWFTGNGDGSFQPEVRFAGGYALGPIVAADFNHDGRLDLAGGVANGVATLLNISHPVPLTVVSAASFAVGPLSPDSLATVFGSGLNAGTAVSIEGISAAVLYASAGQVNFLVPASLVPGPATVAITSSAASASASVAIATVAPAVFTLNSAGLAAAYVVRVRQGEQTIEPVSSPIDLGPPEEQVYLSLFGTGIRGADAGQITVRIQGITAPVVYAGPQPQFAGLDQINVQLPRELTGTGDASLVLNAAGIDAPTVHISIQ